MHEFADDEAELEGSFTDCILQFSRGLREADDVAPDIKSQFFYLCQSRDSLPPKSSKEIIDAFLASLVSVVNLHTGQPLQIEALGYLFKFIKNGKREESNCCR